MNEVQPPSLYWSQDVGRLLRDLKATPAGLTTDEAERRLEIFGENRPGRRARATTLSLLVSQFGNPIVVLLFVASDRELAERRMRCVVKAVPAGVAQSRSGVILGLAKFSAQFLAVNH